MYEVIPRLFSRRWLNNPRMTEPKVTAIVSRRSAIYPLPTPSKRRFRTHCEAAVFFPPVDAHPPLSADKTCELAQAAVAWRQRNRDRRTGGVHYRIPWVDRSHRQRHACHLGPKLRNITIGFRHRESRQRARIAVRTDGPGLLTEADVTEISHQSCCRGIVLAIRVGKGAR